jgi:hypothetical protein
MLVTEEENTTYGRFINDLAKETGCFNLSGDDILWHYTDAQGFLGILESGKLRATQVAALNDSKEVLYARDIFRAEITALHKKDSISEPDKEFLGLVSDFLHDDPAEPDHGRSNFFVTCFSGRRDDLTQWDRYGKGNGYAIGLIAKFLHRGPNSSIYRIIYDPESQKRAANQLAEATLRFFNEGLTAERSDNRKQWMNDF